MATKISEALRTGRFGNGRLPGAIAAGLVAALALGAQEAKAQPVFQCPAASPPVTAVFPPGFDLSLLTADHLRAIFRAAGPVVIPTEPVDCGFVNHDGTRNVVVRNPRITVNEDLYAGISAWRQGGNGDLVVYVHGVDATGAPQHFHPIDHGRYAVRTMGDGEWNVGEEAYGIWASHTGRGRVAIDFRDLSLSTAGGDAAHGIYATQQGSYFYENGRAHRSRGAVIVNVIETERDREGRVRPLIGTRGDESDAIRAEYTRATAKGHIAITVEGYTIATGGIVPKGPQFPNNQGVPGVEPGPLLPSLNGYESRAIHALHEGLGDIRIAVTDSRLLTWGNAAHGILANHTGRSETITNLDRTTEVRTGGGAIDIDVAGGEIRTAGANSSAIYGWHRGAGDVAIDATGVAIATAGEESQGILAWIRQATTTEGDRIVAGTETEVIAGTGEGDIAISVTGGAISTQGESAHAVWGKHDHEGAIAVGLAGGVAVATTGARAHGVFAEHGGTTGDVAVTVEGGSIATRGGGSHGIYARQVGSGDLAISVTGGTVAAQGEGALGIWAVGGSAGDVSVDIAGGAGVTVGGADGIGVLVITPRASPAAGAGQGARTAAATPANEHGGTVRVTVGEGASVTAAGTGIALRGDGASGTVQVDGAVTGGSGPAVHLRNGGAVTVGADGRVVAGSAGHAIVSGITGEEGAENHLRVVVEGRVEGHIMVQDDSDLFLAVRGEGTIAGSIFTVGRGNLMILPGTTIAGTIYNPPQQPYPVDDITVGRIVFDLDRYAGGATVTITETGRITGVITGGTVEAIRNDQGNLTVELRAGAGETPPEATGRIGGVIRTTGDRPTVWYKPAGEERQFVGTADSTGAVVVGAWDVGLAREEGPRYRLRSYYAPRARLYEALPSALLRLNRLATRDQRLAAPRAVNGAWAIVEAGKGAAQASRSTTQADGGSDYDYNRYGARAGVEVPVNDDGLAIGISVHHLIGDVELARNAGEIDAWGAGFGFSGSWESEDGAYVDGQFQATLWEAWLASGLRGTLAAGARGTGYAAGVEIGRRYAMGMSGLGDLSLLPRARLVHTRVDMDDFADRVTGRSVSLEKSRSLRGRAGVGVETMPPGPGAGRLFAALEVEREFSPDTRVVYAGTALEAKAESTWVRAELGAAREWDEGRYALQGRLNYAAASGDNRDYGGNVSLKLRF